jgi:nucleoside-diphosphate-sugar epimerase
MDEAHPVCSTDAYSVSKHIIEEVGEYFWRREGISSAALRLPWVAPVEQHELMGQRLDSLGPLVERLLAKSPEERRAWFDTAWQAYNAFRAKRPYESRGYAMEFFKSLPDEERIAIRAMSNRVNFYTMLDERDSAQAMDLALTVPYDGAHTLFINDSHNWSGIDSQILVDLFYPDVPLQKKVFTGTETIISIDRARELIGFEPEYSFDHR